jgi:cyanophycinase
MLTATATLLTVAAVGLEGRAADQPSSLGIYIVTSGGEVIDAYFKTLVTGRDRVVFIPTAAPFLLAKGGVIWNPDRDQHREAFVRGLAERFGVATVDILHTRSRDTANTEAFAARLRQADAVWIAGGYTGLLASAYLDTLVMSELHALVRRGGILAGESAGAIILGSYVVRGNPEEPVLMAEGHDRGFGFLPNVAINPHLTRWQREKELVTVVDRYPHLLGLGVDDNTALVIRGDIAEVIGSGRVTVYDNQKHGGHGYFWLKSGEKLDLVKRKTM